MNDIPLRFRKNIVSFAAGLILSVMFGLICCMMLALAVNSFFLNYEATEEFAFAAMDLLMALPVVLPLLAVSIAGALMAGHHRRAYVTISEEGLTVHDVVQKITFGIPS